MTAGLPGAGIGGLFYLVGALWMPVRELGAWLTGTRPPRLRLAAGQFAIAVAVIGSIHLTGRALGVLLAAAASSGAPAAAATTTSAPSALRAATVLLSLATLVAVLLAVQLARLVVASEPAEPRLPASTPHARRAHRKPRSGRVRANSATGPRRPTPEPRRRAGE